MILKKIFSLAFLPLLLTSFLFSQSLVELAKKEKERREKLKGKKAQVVTNADLAKLKRKPAISTPQLAPTGEQTKKGATPTTTSPPERAQPTLDKNIDRTGLAEARSQLENKWNRAKEYVSLLTTKMNALWQEFYSMDDMTDRGSIQRQISETFLQLQKAKEEEAKIRKELEQSKGQIRKSTDI